MTKIIVGKLEKNSFSLLQFYAARARRIVPALLGLCAVLLLVGLVWIDPAVYRRLSLTVVTALLFVSNIQFWREAGYFDLRSESKWLLHTWSLAVEWQFYLLYPLFLMGVYKLFGRPQMRTTLLWAALLLSFGLSVVMTPNFASGSFFLLPTRAWEMLAGSVVAVRFDRGLGRYGWPCHLLGLAMIGASLALYDVASPWPSYNAALPVLGTALVIAARRTTSPLTGTWPFQLLGSWSYAIYIWHWPIVVGTAYFDAPDTLVFKLTALAVIIGGGAALLNIVTVLWMRLWPRALGHDDRRTGLRLAGASAIAIAAALVVFSTGGLEVRVGSHLGQFRAYESAMIDWNPQSACSRQCRLGAATDHGTLVIGDSFAEQMYPRAEVVVKTHPEASFEFITLDGCVPMPGVNNAVAGSVCDGFMKKAFEVARTAPYDRLMLVSMWYPYFTVIDGKAGVCFIEGASCVIERNEQRFEAHVDAVFDAMRTFLLEIRQRGIRVTIVLPTPFSKKDTASELIKQMFSGRPSADVLAIDRKAFEARYARVHQHLVDLAFATGADLVDPLNSLCLDGACPTVDAAGMPLYRDSAHFRASIAASNRFKFFDRASGFD